MLLSAGVVVHRNLCPSVGVFVRRCLRLPVRRCFRPPVFPSAGVSVRRCLCPPVRRCLRPPVSPSTCPPLSLSACPPVSLSACPPVSLSVCIFAHLSIGVFVRWYFCSPWEVDSHCCISMHVRRCRTSIWRTHVLLRRTRRCKRSASCART
jgi:hypothetical protein